MQEGDSGRARRYCASCGTRISPQDVFCANCGARLSPGTGDESPTREISQPVRRWTGGYTLPRFLQFPDPGRDVLLALALALACAGLLVVALSALLAVRGAFSDPSTPSTIGLALFALMHGGAASVDVPPIPALLGLGGSLRLGLPVTSFALLPFVASLLAGRFLGQWVRTVGLFVLVAAVAYAVVVAALALLGASSSESGGVTVRFAPDPLSTALRAFLWVGLGTMVGVAASRGPLLPARVRQIIRGALWAVGISLAVTIVLAVVIALVQQGLGGPEPAQRAPEGLPQPALGDASVREALATIGAVFALLPIALGNLWLLAHGVPVGFQNASDLSGVPLIGEALAGVPLRVALLGHWPWGGAWRLLLMGPLVGLVVGGMVATRGAPLEGRWRQGALVALPYAAIALLTAVLVGVTADVTLAGAAKLEVAFRASLAWLLLLLPVGAGLGAVGGLLSRGDAVPIAHPNRAFLATSIASTFLVLASLPAVAGLSPAGTQPAGTKASGEQPFASPSPSGREGNAGPSAQEERADDGGTGTDSTKDSAKGGGGPKSGYQRVTDLGGALSVEVPIGWETMTSDDASVEVRNAEGVILSQELTSAEIDASPELDLYNRYQESGTSLIVVKALAQDYTDDQLLDGVRGLYRHSRSCSDGGRRDYKRAPYSGRIQTWNDCNLGVSTVHTLVAAPKDRGCAALLWIAMVGESDREAAQHILDTFKVDCGRLPASATTAVASPTAPPEEEVASPSASAELSASASAFASAQVQTAGPAYNFIEVPRGTPPCPLGLDEVRATYGPNVTCGEGGGYVPATGGE